MFFQDRQFPVPAGELLGDGKADNTGADDDYIEGQVRGSSHGAVGAPLKY